VNALGLISRPGLSFILCDHWRLWGRIQMCILYHYYWSFWDLQKLRSTTNH